MAGTEGCTEPTRAGSDPNTWFEQHGDYLYRFALSRVRRAEAAEDLVQETLLAAWRTRSEYDGRSSERTWLTAILKYKVIDWLRRRVKEENQLQTFEEDKFLDEFFDSRGHWRASPSRWRRYSVEPLDREQFWSIFQNCQSKLPMRLNEVFVLRYLDETASDVMCEELGLSQRNLWVMLHRARMRMWTCLSKNWFGEDSNTREQSS
jgi:RNA polymerase sigma-70 factor (ECF subfamily)